MVPLVSQCNTLLFVSIWTVYRTASVPTCLNTKQGHGDVRNVPKPKAWLRHSVQISDRLRGIEAAVLLYDSVGKVLGGNTYLHMRKSMWIFWCIFLGYIDIWSKQSLISFDFTDSWFERKHPEHHKLAVWAANEMERHNLVGRKTSRSHSSLLHLHITYII